MLYWAYLIVFIIAVLVPDLVRGNVFFLSETRAEEIALFLMGVITFIIILKNEQKIIFHKKEKEKDAKKIEQTIKDLVESYSYIGEINRKMDILMSIALGFSDSSDADKINEKEIYMSISNAADSLLKSKTASLKFVDITTGKTKKEFHQENGKTVNNIELLDMKANTNIKEVRDFLIVSSTKDIKNIKSYLIIDGYENEEKNNPKNMEILKAMASQALFLYSYMRNQENPKPCK